MRFRVGGGSRERRKAGGSLGWLCIVRVTLARKIRGGFAPCEVTRNEKNEKRKSSWRRGRKEWKGKTVSKVGLGRDTHPGNTGKYGLQV